MTTQSALIGFMLSTLAGATVLAAQAPRSDPGFELLHLEISGLKGDEWSTSVDDAAGRITYSRRGTYQGSVARLSSIVIGMVEAGAVDAGMAGDSLAGQVMAARVVGDRARGRATGDYRVAEVQASDTVIGQLKVYVLRYRRVMMSWKNAGWAEALTVYLFFSPDFPEQHQLIQVEVSEKFQVRSTGNQAPEDSAAALMVIGQLQGESGRLSSR